MLLKNKNAVIYGAGGAIGGAVARAFAREGARLFLSGRNIGKINTLVSDIVAAGGQAEAAEVDATDENAVKEYVKGIVDIAGSIDISFNLIGIDDVQGISVVDISVTDFERPVVKATRTQFITSSVASRYMVEKGAGVILMLSATPGRMAIPLTGGFGMACAAIEGLSRSLTAELGPKGVRVICLRSSGSPDAPGAAAAGASIAKSIGMSEEEIGDYFTGLSPLRRMPMIADVGNVAAFMASDHAAAMTGAIINLTCGQIVD